MKSGDIVTVYHDPITQKDTEGKARIIRKLLNMGSGFEYWEVLFLGQPESESVPRTIKVN